MTMSAPNPIISNAKKKIDYKKIIKTEDEEKFLEEKLNEFSHEINEINEDKRKAAENIQKWYDEFDGEGKSDLDKELNKPANENASKTKHYERNITIFAGGGLAFIAVLLILSAACASTNMCVATITETVDGIEKISTKQTNLPLDILQSQFMIVLVGTVIAPVIVRVMKEKYDIQIEESQISMIMQDAISTVKMYSKEANKLRQSNGHLFESDQKKLRDLAFTSMKTNYTWEKYNSIISNVGVQIFDKAIESAVKQGKLERLPLEKNQILEIFKQSIDALPQIVEWQKLDPKIKEQFIEGHISKLLTNVGIDGWAHKTLGEYFDVEVNKRLVAAAIADKDTILKKLDSENRYLKYTTIIVDSISESISKTKND